MKTLQNGPQKLLIIGPNPFFSQSSPAHSPELIFHIINMSQDPSVSLSVLLGSVEGGVFGKSANNSYLDRFQTSLRASNIRAWAKPRSQ